jgi:hypothetical protein
MNLPGRKEAGMYWSSEALLVPEEGICPPEIVTVCM